MDATMFERLTRLAATPSRRDVLKLVTGAGAGLVLGVNLSLDAGAEAQAGAPAPLFTPFVRVSPDNKVVVLSKHLDKGQGVASGLASLVAEELDADPSQVGMEFAPANAALYKNLLFGIQGTGGSSSIANSYEQYRTAGAAARAMLVAAAAKRWGVSASAITVEKGVVASGNNRATFGELAEAAAKLPVPEKPKLKDAKDFRIIGRSFARLDMRAKTTGSAIFTQDLRLPGMLVAVAAHSPRFGGQVKSVDDAKARAVPGVVDVVRLPRLVAVLAKSTHAAIQGRDALKIEWDDSKSEMRGSAELIAEFRKLADTSGMQARDEGDAAEAMKRAAKVIDAEYVFPYLAHATMEPMNAVVAFKDGKATVWTGSQLQTIDQTVVAGVLAIRPEDVTINTQWAGGSFGRRGDPTADYVREAAEIVKAWGKADPVQLVWTREDDMRAGRYRPLVVHKVKVGLDAGGTIIAWHHRIVGQSIMAGTPFETAMSKLGVDATLTEGIADTRYAIPNMRVEAHHPRVGVPVLWWRSVGHTHTAYVMETMIDEIARTAGKDPVAYRLSLLARQPRHQGVLKLAAEKAGWGKPLAPGRFRGVAVHESFSSFVAEVAEIALDEKGGMKVEKVWAAVDCGVAVNPDIVKAQIEGGIGYGLSAILKGEITLKDGIVEQTNFDGYDVLRINEMPLVEVHIVSSDAKPTGVGEPGTPPIGPAIANAIASAGRQIIRTPPLSRHGLG